MALQLEVAGERVLVFDRDRVHVRRAEAGGDLDAVVLGMVDRLIQQEAHPLATVRLDDGVDGLEPLTGLYGIGVWDVCGHALGRLAAVTLPPDTLPRSMPTGEHTVAEGQPDNAAARLRAATELLESVVADRGLLGLLSVEERTRLLSAAADVFNPDVVQRRRFTKAQRKQEKASRIGADESLLSETGIRALREKPVFTTPNVYPPRGFDLAILDPRSARDTRGAALLRLQAAVPGIASVLRPAVPTVRGVQLREAFGDRRPPGEGCAPDGRTRQDRVPGWDQAAARGRPSHRHHAFSPRFGGSVFAGGRLRRLG